MFQGGLPESFELDVTDTFIFLIFTPLTTIMMMISVCARRRPPWEFWATHRQALSNSASLGCSDRWEIKTKNCDKDKYNDEYQDKDKYNNKYRDKAQLRQTWRRRHLSIFLEVCVRLANYKIPFAQNFLQCDRDFLTTLWYESQVGQIIEATLHRTATSQRRASAISNQQKDFRTVFSKLCLVWCNMNGTTQCKHLMLRGSTRLRTAWKWCGTEHGFKIFTSMIRFRSKRELLLQ